MRAAAAGGSSRRSADACGADALRRGAKRAGRSSRSGTDACRAGPLRRKRSRTSRRPRPDPAEVRLKALGVRIRRPIGKPLGDTVGTGTGAARRRSVGVAAAANGATGSARLAAGALAGFAPIAQSCRAGRTGGLRGASERADLRHAATADAVGTGGAFAPASSRAGSRRPRTIFCRRLRLSDQLAMCEGWGGPLPRAGLRRRQNRLSGARPRMRRRVRSHRPITGRSSAPTRKGARGFMPRRSRPRSGGAGGRGARTPPFPSPPARMRHRSRQPTI